MFHCNVEIAPKIPCIMDHLTYETDFSIPKDGDLSQAPITCIPGIHLLWKCLWLTVRGRRTLVETDAVSNMK